MSFDRVRRQLLDRKKPELVEAGEIVLKWSDNPPSPCVQIHIGHDLARAFGLRAPEAKLQLLVGREEDAGKVALKFTPESDDGDYRCVSDKWGYKVFLPAHISVEHFAFCPRTTVPASRIELRGQMLVFNYAGLNVDPHRSYRGDR